MSDRPPLLPPRRRRSRCAPLELLDPLEPRWLLSVTVNINTAQQYQTMDGFGTAIADWSNEYASTAWQQMYYQDLGASMLRINVTETALEASPGDMTTPVVLTNNLQQDISLFNFTGSEANIEGVVAAAGQTDALDQEEVIASVWSPPNWMKGADANGNLPQIIDGNSCGGSLIDTPANLQQFGWYVAAWVKGFEQTYGVPIYALSIQNELAFSESYDSCTYTPQTYVDALKAVASAFQEFGITTKLEGPEDVGVGDSSDPWILWRQMQYIDAVRADPVAMADLAIYSIHGYADDGVTTDRSPEMWSEYWNGRSQADDPSPAGAWWTGISGDGKESWMTETSGEAQTFAGALTTAAQIQDALVDGNVSAYLYWQTTADGVDSTETLTSGTDTTQPKYNAFKQFSKYIRPGSVRVEATPSDPNGVYVSAFVQNQQQTLTTVLLNLGTTDETVSLDITGVSLGSFDVDVRTSATEECVSLAPVAVVDGVATFDLPAQCIVTLQGSTAAAPAAPTTFTATPGSGQITLSWNAVSGATNYTVARSATEGGPYTAVATGVNGTSYVDTAVVTGTTYYYVVWGSNAGGAGALSAQVAANPLSVWQVVAPNGQSGDFNDDGTTDILLENSSTGQFGAWLVHSGAAPTWSSMGALPAGWQITGLGDFNGDGTTDLLLQNGSSGYMGTWLISNGQISGWAFMGQVPTGWSVAQVGDFTGNGTSDLLLRNESSGQTGVWLINDGHISGWANLGTLPPTLWNIAGVGDFTGNGIDDLLLWNQTTGVLGAWLLNSNGQVAGWDGITSLAPDGYNIETGDFNGDGTTDIGALNTADGQLSCWFLSGGAINGPPHPLAALPAGWSVEGAGDYSGNGTDDLLLMNAATGQIGTWLVTISAGNPVLSWESIGSLA